MIRLKIPIALILTALAIPKAHAFDVTVRKIHDGDTIEIYSKALPLPLANMAIRLAGIDTPELRGKCQAEKDKAKLARDYLKSYVKAGDVLNVAPLKWDKYGGRFEVVIAAQSAQRLFRRHLLELRVGEPR